MRASLLLASASAVVALDPSISHGPKRQASAALYPRQTGGSDDDSGGGGGMYMQTIDETCLSNALDFFNSMPTVSPELHQAIDGPNQGDCVSLPESLDSEFLSYSSAIGEWYAENSDVFHAVGSNCPTPTDDEAMAEQSFCEGEGPDDRDDAAGSLRVSIAAVACVFLSTALLI